jgi:adenosine 3'-phospho 5'-phosphosulfate transporter B3
MGSPQKALFYSVIFFASFVGHDFLQELIISTPKWNFPLFMTLLEFGSCCILPLLFERPFQSLDRPISSYAALTCCVLGSAIMANLSLAYVNYPVKVVFKSTKLLGTMGVSLLMLPGKNFSRQDFLAAAFLCGGLMVFVLADVADGGRQTTTTGLLLLAGAVLCDSTNPILQEKLMKHAKRAPAEVMFFTNAMGVMILLPAMCTPFSNMELIRVVTHLSSSWNESTTIGLGLLPVRITFGATTYIGVKAYMALVNEFGGVFAVTVATSRKICTVALSFLWFSHTLTLQHVLGGTAVLVGVVLKQMAGKRQKRGMRDPTRV